MLHDDYLLDKCFKEIAGYFSGMDPAPVKAEACLEDEKLQRKIMLDLAGSRHSEPMIWTKAWNANLK